jgi:pyridoxine 5-phosphate synthase
VTTLSVNIDHIATIREARKTNEPDPIEAAVLAELAGADGITLHLRGDRRHIKERDVHLLRQFVKTKLNMEMAATQEMIDIAIREKVNICSLVPEKPEEVTTTGGLDVISNRAAVDKAIKQIQGAAIIVSIFVDPVQEQIEECNKLDANCIEINTGKYADAQSERQALEELEKIKAAAELGAQLGIKVVAGHGLTYRNVKTISDIPEIQELNIGHSIIARAALVGLEKAVREMKEIMQR